MRSSGDTADRFTEDTVTPEGPHDLGTRIAHLLQGDSPEAFPSLDPSSPPVSQRRSPKPTCRSPNGSQTEERCQGDPPRANGAKRTNPWPLAGVGHRDAAEPPASPISDSRFRAYAPLYVQDSAAISYGAKEAS